MKTIENIENITIINKSKFITNLFYVENIDEVNKYLSIIKDKYKDATHHCYAYIIDNTKRFNDDNEPAGTAGMPILECLEKNNLNYVLCIVTRYFGGIKLGAGGLLRAYSNSYNNAIKNTVKYKLVNGFIFSLEIIYNKLKDIELLLKEYIVINKEFNDNIKFIIEADDNLLDALKNNNIKYEIIDKKIIKKL